MCFQICLLAHVYPLISHFFCVRSYAPFMGVAALKPHLFRLDSTDIDIHSLKYRFSYRNIKYSIDLTLKLSTEALDLVLTFQYQPPPHHF